MSFRQKLPFRVIWYRIVRRGVVVIEEVFPDDHLFVHFVLCWAVSEQQAHAIAWRMIKKHYGGDVFAEDMDASVDLSAAVLMRQNGKNGHLTEATPRARRLAKQHRKTRRPPKPQLNLFPSDALHDDP